MEGRVLNGRYELTEKIGEGGMALTWKGRYLLLDRDVAVKVMRESLAADPQFIARFRQEAQAAANLTNEHIAAIYDFGTDDGVHYIVMEYVPGEDLKRYLKRKGPLPLAEALEIAIQVGEALEVAHAKGIVHRDIKPANILLTEEGKVKVADFGIARAFSAPDDNSTGTLIGSVHYISPEHARGEAVGPQADIYSLGTVIFELLTGRPPFQASNPVAIVHKHIYDPPPSPRSLRADLPVEIEGILLRSLAKDLMHRYATAREILNYLRVAQGKFPALTEKSAIEPAAVQKLPGRIFGNRDYRRRLIPALVIAGIVVLGGAGLVVRGLRADRAGQIEVPGLVGLDITSARAVANEMDLRLNVVGGVYSTNVPKDRITSQFPLPEVRVGKGTAIEVRLSLGQEVARIPNVTEMSESQARKTLEDASLKVGGVREEFSQTVEKGVVISSEPPAGAQAPKDGAVILVISKGPELPKVEVPPIPPLLSEGNINFTAPPNGDVQAKMEVIVEVSDPRGLKVLYQGMLSPGESMPPQKLPTDRPLTVRIKLDGRVVRETTFEH